MKERELSRKLLVLFLLILLCLNFALFMTIATSDTWVTREECVATNLVQTNYYMTLENLTACQEYCAVLNENKGVE